MAWNSSFIMLVLACFASKTGWNKFFQLNDVLHVPKISKNLMIVSKFDKDNNMHFEFYPHHCVVKDNETNKISLLRKCNKSIYCFNLNLKNGEKILGSMSTSLTSSIHDSNSLHNKRMCNVNSVNLDLWQRHDKLPKNADVLLWHMRLGHLSAKVVVLVLNQCEIC